VDPSQVTTQDLHNHAVMLETKYQRYNQAEGIIWQAYRTDPALEHPNKYGSGGDSCIFTGHKLATDVFRYGVTKESADLDKVMQSLRGLYILTHISGTPGVIARCAFPENRSSEWGYPESWGGRDQRFVHTSQGNIADPMNGGHFPKMVYYTRGTKDQLTGVLFGLATAWKHLKAENAGDTGRVNQARLVLARISEDVYNHLRAYDFKIRDENGDNDTTADSVSGLLYVNLLAVYRATVGITSPDRAARINEKYGDEFSSGFFNPHDSVNIFSSFSGYYAWNLRHLRGYSIYILEENAERKSLMRRWFEDRLWQYTSGHLNAKFAFIQNAVNPAIGGLEDALFSMKSLRLKPIRSYSSPLADDERKPSLLQVLAGDTDRFVLPPHLRKPTSYSTWQKEPWDVGHAGNGASNSTGLDFMLGYWMGRYHGFIPAK